MPIDNIDIPQPSVDPTEVVVSHRAKNWNSKICMSWEQLIAEQKRDRSLSAPFESGVSENESDRMSVVYFTKDGVLVRKWTLRIASSSDNWNTVTQIVVPKPFRNEILRLAHDDPFAGHLGVNKTYDRVLRWFFWPGLKRDVKEHCKTMCVKSVASPVKLSQPIRSTQNGCG